MGNGLILLSIIDSRPCGTVLRDLVVFCFFIEWKNGGFSD